MNNQGFTLFISVVIMGTLLLIATAVASLALKQAFISSTALKSQNAFYAADTGMECALYWDVANPSGDSAFSTTTTSSIHCNQNTSNPGNTWTVGGMTTSTINRINFAPDPFCAIVTVVKKTNGTTLIESRGYNTCSATDPRRVERAVRASYDY